MRSWKWVLLLSFFPFVACCQKQDRQVKKKAFHAVINTLIAHSVDEQYPENVLPNSQFFLDAREKKEYDVSRIDGAQYVGYDSFDIKLVEGIKKDSEIIVYCSIGYRSEKIAEKLMEAGFTNVSNLYGGIFEWYNEGMPVVDSLGQETNRVHGYGKLWGKWLNNADVVYE